MTENVKPACSRTFFGGFVVAVESRGSRRVDWQTGSARTWLACRADKLLALLGASSPHRDCQDRVGDAPMTRRPNPRYWNCPWWWILDAWREFTIRQMCLHWASLGSIFFPVIFLCFRSIPTRLLFPLVCDCHVNNLYRTWENCFFFLYSIQFYAILTENWNFDMWKNVLKNDEELNFFKLILMDFSLSWSSCFSKGSSKK